MRLGRAELPAVYAITLDSPALALAEQVRRLAASGLSWIQLRVKRDDDLQLWNAYASVDFRSPVKLIVNDRVDLALSLGAAGVHLGDSDLPVAAARRVASELVIGVSTHTVEDAITAADDSTVDYVAIGPVFRSPTKDVRAPLGLSAVAEIRRRTEKPLVAIGGIHRHNIADVLAAGADSAAVISALFDGGAIERNVSELLRAAERG